MKNLRPKNVAMWAIALGVLVLLADHATAGNGCNPGIDPVCNTNPVDKCDIVSNLNLNTTNFNLPNGMDMCANNIILDCKGATLTGVNTWVSSGVSATNAQGITVKNCTLQKYFFGIYSQSPNNLFADNTATSNTYGFLIRSPNNTLLRNTANMNYMGIFLHSSPGSMLAINTANTNTYDGIDVYVSPSTTLVNNLANGNLLSGIMLSASPFNTLIGNTASSNGVGLAFTSSSNSNLARGNIMKKNSVYGVYVSLSAANVISSGNITSNGNGIYLISASNNLIFDNFFSNPVNAIDTGMNLWNSTKDCSQQNILGYPCRGGNFWFNYTTADEDGDGLGDTNVPYNQNITNGGDFLPLTTPNFKPVILTSPVTQATVNNTYIYDVNAIDPDTDPLVYALVESPPGMVIDPFGGLIQWLANITLPTFQSKPKAGIGAVRVNVSVMVSDPFFARDVQNFTITVWPEESFVVDPFGDQPSQTEDPLTE